MTLSDPTQIWSIIDNLDVYTARENKGQFITHLMKGEGPFKVVATYRYGEDPAHKGWPCDFYFKINLLLPGNIVKTGWVTGVKNSDWKISYTDPAPDPVPVPPPGSYQQYLVTIYPDKPATIELLKP